MASRKVAVAAAALLVAVGLAAGAWHRFAAKPPAPPVPPVVPERVDDPTVRAALEAARQQVVEAPGSAAAWGEYGLVLRAHRLTADSNACFAQAARLDPNDPRWPYLIGLANLQDDPGNAVPYFRTAAGLARTPEYRSATRLRLAEVLLLENQTAEAVTLFEEELQYDRQSARARYGLAVAAAGRGDPAAVIRYLAPVAADRTIRQKAAALLGTAHQQLGDREAAQRYAAEVTRPPPDASSPDPFVSQYLGRDVSRRARLQRVLDLQDRGRIGEALGPLEALARDFPTDDHVQMTLAIFLAELGETERAERLARAAVALGPAQPINRYYLGVIVARRAEALTAAGDRERVRQAFEEALGEFREATRLKPDFVEPRVSAGLALRGLGRLPEATEEFRAAVRLSPQSAEPHFRLGEALIESGDPAAAVGPLEEAVRLAPMDPRPAAALAKARAAGKK